MSNHNDPGNDGKDPTNNDVCQAYVYDLVDIAKPLLVLSSRTDHLAINIIPLSESSRVSKNHQSYHRPILSSQQLINFGCCHYWSPCHPCQPQSCPTWVERQIFHKKNLKKGERNLLRAVGFFNAEDIEGILADTSTHCHLRCGQNAADEK